MNLTELLDRYPFEVREIARSKQASAAHLTTHAEADWELAALGGPVTRIEIQRNVETIASRRIAEQFAQHVLRAALWRESPRGLLLDLDTYCFTHDELLALLNRAFDAGVARQP